jgi:hypothetical protein
MAGAAGVSVVVTTDTAGVAVTGVCGCSVAAGGSDGVIAAAVGPSVVVTV